MFLGVLYVTAVCFLHLYACVVELMETSFLICLFFVSLHSFSLVAACLPLEGHRTFNASETKKFFKM